MDRCLATLAQGPVPVIRRFRPAHRPRGLDGAKSHVLHEVLHGAEIAGGLRRVRREVIDLHTAGPLVVRGSECEARSSRWPPVRRTESRDQNSARCEVGIPLLHPGHLRPSEASLLQLVDPSNPRPRSPEESLVRVAEGIAPQLEQPATRPVDVVGRSSAIRVTSLPKRSSTRTWTRSWRPRGRGF